MLDHRRTFDDATLTTPYRDYGELNDDSIGLPDFRAIDEYPEEFRDREVSIARYFRNDHEAYDSLRYFDSNGRNEFINETDLEEYIDAHWDRCEG
jgi:hypothetical protein